MASLQNFRSALNGFNRDDVVHYLEYANSKHEKQCAQLREQIRALQEELTEVRVQAVSVPRPDPAAAAQLEELNRRCTVLEQENAALRGQVSISTAGDELDALRREADSCSRENKQLRETVDRLTRERDQALSERQALISRTDEELAAYRRAERTERIAQTRASQIYSQVSAALSSAAAELDETIQTISTVTDDTVRQIQTLREVVSAGKSSFAAAEAALQGIRPAEEEQA